MRAVFMPHIAQSYQRVIFLKDGWIYWHKEWKVWRSNYRRRLDCSRHWPNRIRRWCNGWSCIESVSFVKLSFFRELVLYWQE